jgi:multiple sugar transport system permease protein
MVEVWHWTPLVMLLVLGGLASLPVDPYEAAKIDGATGWQAFRRVTFPLIVPAILIAALFRLIFAFRLFSEVWLLTEGGPARTTEVVAVYLYLEAFRYNAFGAAAATGWLMVVGSLLLAAPYLWRLARERAKDAA